MLSLLCQTVFVYLNLQHAKSGESKSYCLNRAKVWNDYCENPVIATYLPEGVSSNWKDQDIQHDNHGG